MKVPARPALPAEGNPALDAQLARLRDRCVWPASPPFILAVSGGADSLALLVLACDAGLDVTAVHVDHGLRPGSDREADVVAAAARRFGAGFEARRVDVAPGADLEARARAARYAALPPGVLTGHTADDQAETVLLNLLRGAGLDGLAGMARTAGESGWHRDPPDARLDGGRALRRGLPVRPLLGLRRSETRGLCEAAGLVAVDDPSNADQALRRNSVRHRLLPLLAEIGGRDPVPVLVRQSALLADDAALLEALSDTIDPTDVAALRAAPPPLARRALRRWLRAAGDAERHPPTAAEVARVLAVVEGDVVACQIGGGRRIARRAGRLRLDGPDPGWSGRDVAPVGSAP